MNLIPDQILSKDLYCKDVIFDVYEGFGPVVRIREWDPDPLYIRRKMKLLSLRDFDKLSDYMDINQILERVGRAL